MSRPFSISCSDIKYISINGNGEVMYVQSMWRQCFGSDVQILEMDGGVKKKKKKNPILTSIYKARATVVCRDSRMVCSVVPFILVLVLLLFYRCSS